MLYLRLIVVSVLLAFGGGCGDDETDSKKPDASDTDPDASDSKDCPASGEPAVPSCPCKKPEGEEYCCGVGHGVICEKKVWLMFFDSPCTAPPPDDAGEQEFDPSTVKLIECRR